MKNLYLFILLSLAACQQSTPQPLSENEQLLLGNWMNPVNNGALKGMYLEFHENRKGGMGAVLELEAEQGLLPTTYFQIEHWQLLKDTLTIQYKMLDGIVGYDSEGSELKQKAEVSREQYLVWKISESEMILEDLKGVLPTKDRYRPSAKMKILD